MGQHLPRVGIFQYDWPLQMHTINLATAFASKGYRVHLFLKGCTTDFVDLGRLKQHPGIRTVNFDPTNEPGKIVRALSRLVRGAMNHVAARTSYAVCIFPAAIAAFRYIRQEQNWFFIGVEKKGMIWASFLSRLTGAPFVYYNLELYDEEHPFFADVAGFSALRRLEKKSHRKAVATIIQDRLRKEHLFRMNGITDNSTVFLPVSVPGSTSGREGEFSRTKWGTWKGPLVLYLGLISRERRCLELARVAHDHADTLRVAFHGYGDPMFLQQVRDAGGKGLILSTELVAEDLVPLVAASADIGLALYDTSYANDALTAFASEKVALYCRAGVPFIAFDTPSFRELAESFPCCVLVKEIGELPGAVEAIMKDYPLYRANALKAFEKYYHFEKNAAEMIRQLNAILPASSC